MSRNISEEQQKKCKISAELEQSKSENEQRKIRLVQAQSKCRVRATYEQSKSRVTAEPSGKH